MTKLETAICEGGTIGKEVEERIKQLCNLFFRLGVKVIETECNNRRQVLVNEWRQKEPHEFMRAWGLPDTTYEQGIAEATPLFDLFQPDTIELCIYESRVYSEDPRIPMLVESLDLQGTNTRLHVFLRNLHRRGKSFHWTGFCMSLDECLVHEVLHACGDAPWRGRHDGRIRHNIIGIEAVRGRLPITVIADK